MIGSVKIGEMVYSIELVPEPTKSDPDGKNETKYYFGVIDHIDNTIQIREDMNADVKRTAMLHEILHGIVHQSGIFSDDEEQFVHALSFGLLALLRNNPALIDYLLQKD